MKNNLRSIALLAVAFLIGCQGKSARPGQPIERVGDEIIVCGQLFHTGAPVVLWLDPGRYDAYRIDKKFGPTTRRAIGEHRYGPRMSPLTDAEVIEVRENGWTLHFLRKNVDQFV